MALKWVEPLDPDEQKWYSVNWDLLASAETITASSWVIDPELSQLDTSFNGSTTAIKLAGATGFVAGRLYTVQNTIDTTDTVITARYQRTIHLDADDFVGGGDYGDDYSDDYLIG